MAKKSASNKGLLLGLFALAVVAIPATVAMTLNQQNTQSNAAEVNTTANTLTTGEKAAPPILATKVLPGGLIGDLQKATVTFYSNHVNAQLVGGSLSIFSFNTNGLKTANVGLNSCAEEVDTTNNRKLWKCVIQATVFDPGTISVGVHAETRVGDFQGALETKLFWSFSNAHPYLATRALPTGKVNTPYNASLTFVDTNLNDSLNVTLGDDTFPDDLPKGLTKNCSYQGMPSSTKMICTISGTPTETTTSNSLRVKVVDKNNALGVSVIPFSVIQ